MVLTRTVFHPQNRHPTCHVGVSQAMWTSTMSRPAGKCKLPPANQCQMVLFPYVVHTLGIMRWLQYLVCRCISARVDSVDWKRFARALALACCLPLQNLGGLQEIKQHNGISPLIIVQRDRGFYSQTTCSPLLAMKECKLRERQLIKHITSIRATKAIQLKCRRTRNHVLAQYSGLPQQY